ncbi:uncharacterized protein LOC113333561 [Papaver somniferum]|uniref:uncharacterized protein LOC113333561 n=1 Tax=Papaver somniferum TaxID=3469 RepID=UPI000E6FCC68|nr:uncharacterized protein LOC113333561 [Papaver somniferum]
MPLSIISSFYKVISKLLDDIIKVVMPQLISSALEAFVKHKQILNGILLANECINNRLRQRRAGILCKIDMEKAFYNVNWPSLFAILEKNGFGAKWIKWIRWCVTEAQFSVLVNGATTERIKPSKG